MGTGAGARDSAAGDRAVAISIAGFAMQLPRGWRCPPRIGPRAPARQTAFAWAKSTNRVLRRLQEGLSPRRRAARALVREREARSVVRPRRHFRRPPGR